MNRRVVITGLGPVTPVGTGKEAFWDSVVNGRSHYREISRLPLKAEYGTRIAAEIRDFEPEKYVHERTRNKIRKFKLENAGLSIYYAVAAAKLAVQDSGLDFEQKDKERVGIAFGAAVGDLKIIMEAKPSFYITQFGGLNAFAGAIAFEYGLRGPGRAVSAACATGIVNLTEGFRDIMDGNADIMIVGSTSAPLVTRLFEAFNDPLSPMSRKNDTERGMRPYDKDRDGFVLGEGAGALVVEELEHALERRAHIYAEVIGYGDATDTSTHFADITMDGYFRAMRNAAERAGLNERDFQEKRIYVNTHGTATRKNDIVEPEAIIKLFGDYTKRLLVSSIKGTTGHAQEAASSMELIASALVLDRGIVPPTTSLENPDPECGNLNFVPNEKVEDRIDVVLKNAAGFCGIYSTAVLARYQD